MSFEIFFRIVSYLAVFCGFLALWIPGFLGVAGTLLFVWLMISPKRHRNSRGEISERVGTVRIVLALSAFALELRFMISYSLASIVSAVSSSITLSLIFPNRKEPA